MLLAAGFVASLPLFVSSTTVRGYILEHLSDLSGREISFRGDPRVSFSPFLGIEISDMIISDPAANPGDAALLQIDKVQAQLDILPALIGQMKITQYRLVRPVMNLKVYADGNSNWHLKTGRLKKAFDETVAYVQNEELSEPVSATLGNFVIVDGVVQFEDTIADQKDALTSIDGSIKWPSTDQPADVNGTAVWQGENITSRAIIADPMKLIAGGQSSALWRFESAPATIEFSGEANTLSNLFIKGKIDLSTPSVKRLSEFMTSYFGQVNFSEPVRIQGEIEATAEAIRVTEAKINIAGYPATGVVSLSRDEVASPSLDGTLAFDSVDLSEYLLQGATGAENSSENTNPLDLKVDLRISANSINTGLFELNQVAAAVNVTDEKWTFDIGDSQVFDGRLVAKVSGRQEGENPLVILDIAANDVQTSTIFELLPGTSTSLSGKGNINANLRSRSLSGLLTTKDLNGSLSASLDDGFLIGLDIPFLLSRNITQDEPEPTGDLIGSETPFMSADFKFFVNNGIASISQSTINSPAGNIRMIGRVDLRHGNLALRAQEVTETGPEPERLFIGGTLKAPLISLKKSNLPSQSQSEEEEPENISN